MLFNSQIFIFLFLPICLLGWYFLNHLHFRKSAMIFLTGMSLFFYGFYNPSYLILILGSIAFNYVLSFLIAKTKKTINSNIWMTLGVSGNLLFLGYYKYFDFFIENTNFIFKTDFALQHIILPLGISFFTLQQVSYIIDRCWETAPHYTLVDYMAFVTFFPQLIAGPIVLHSELIPQFQMEEKRKFQLSSFVDGCIYFSLGLGKKVLIADVFAILVNEGFEKIYYIDTPAAWLMALCYLIELYFDFSGYCDMAVGLGKMFGFDLPQNFNSPLKAHSVQDFWQRWHFTLTRFLTTYLYTPLTIMGIRKNKRKLFTYLTPMLVFLISGFWHGASWTFVIWGAFQGLGILWSQRKKWKLKKSGITWFSTFVFAIISNAIFRSETIDNMLRMLKAMFVPHVTGFSFELAASLSEVPEFYMITRVMEILNPNLMDFLYLLLLSCLLLISALILKGKNAAEILSYRQDKGYTFLFAAQIAVIFSWSVLSLNQVSTFLYFNF